MTQDTYIKDAVGLLERLISTPSISRDEARAADIMERAVAACGFEARREANNVWTVDPDYTSSRPTILLNAHIDTVRPAASWRRDPFRATVEGDRIYGLGSNDCGGGLVTLLQVYRALVLLPRSYNLVYLASAEEEVSGQDGIRRALPLLPKIDVAIVGEPTGMQPATAERGLMVLDITAHGRSGHAARGEGINAIYRAMDDLQWIRSYRFRRVSPLLGPTLMNVTMISAGTQHNVVPDTCRMVADVRVNELYDNRELYDFICRNLKSDVAARSFHLRSSHISESHPLVVRCRQMGLVPYGSPTLSDQALMPWSSMKLGPGSSSRSHAADEFVCISEISHAFTVYMQLLAGLKL